MRRPIPLAVSDGLWGIADGSGRGELGWLAPTVLYMRCAGSIGTSLGLELASVTDACFKHQRRLAVFCDAAAAYAAPYKDEMARVALENRARFTHLEVLVQSSIVAFAARSVSTMMGGTLEVTSDAEAFDARIARLVTPLPTWYLEWRRPPARAV